MGEGRSALAFMSQRSESNQEGPPTIWSCLTCHATIRSARKVMLEARYRSAPGEGRIPPLPLPGWAGLMVAASNVRVVDLGCAARVERNRRIPGAERVMVIRLY